MAHIGGEIIIRRPVEDVFEFVADQRNEPHYNPIMESVELLTDGSIGVGTEFHAVARSREQPVEILTMVTGLERPNVIALETHMSAMDIEGTLTFEPVEEGTRMRWSWELQPRGVYWLMGPIIAQLGGRQEARIWAGLKCYLEQEDTESPPDGRQAVAEYK